MDVGELLVIGGSIVAAVLVWGIFSVGRIAIAGDDSRRYKKLLHESEAVGQQTMASLAELRDEMRAVERRLGSIEKMMRDVG